MSEGNNNNNKDKENLSPTLVQSEAYKKTINDFRKTITDLNSDTLVLQDDIAEKDSKILGLERELDSEKARRMRAENLLNEGKKLDNTKSYEETKKELFEERFLKKWSAAGKRG